MEVVYPLSSMKSYWMNNSKLSINTPVCILPMLRSRIRWTHILKNCTTLLSSDVVLFLQYVCMMNFSLFKDETKFLQSSRVPFQ